MIKYKAIPILLSLCLLSSCTQSQKYTIDTPKQLFSEPFSIYDKSIKMENIIFLTKRGKRGYIQDNIFVCFIISLVAAALVQSVYTYLIFKNYGNSGLTFPIQSITGLEKLNIKSNILLGVILLFLFKFFKYFISSLAMLFVSYKSKSVGTAYVINFVVFLLPCIIYFIMASFVPMSNIINFLI